MEVGGSGLLTGSRPLQENITQMFVDQMGEWIKPGIYKMLQNITYSLIWSPEKHQEIDGVITTVLISQLWQPERLNKWRAQSHNVLKWQSSNKLWIFFPVSYFFPVYQFGSLFNSWVRW